MSKITKQWSPTEFDAMQNILEYKLSLEHTTKDQKNNLVC